jgi:hypothetical protein
MHELSHFSIFQCTKDVVHIFFSLFTFDRLFLLIFPHYFCHKKMEDAHTQVIGIGLFITLGEIFCNQGKHM